LLVHVVGAIGHDRRSGRSVDLRSRRARDTPENEVLAVVGHARLDGACVTGGDQQEQEGQRVYVVVSV